jgi:hypothetical protein
MRVLKHGLMAIVCAASVALLSVTLFLCSAWLLSSALPLQLLALTAMSISGSGVIACLNATSQDWSGSADPTGDV